MAFVVLHRRQQYNLQMSSIKRHMICIYIFRRDNFLKTLVKVTQSLENHLELEMMTVFTQCDKLGNSTNSEFNVSINFRYVLGYDNIWQVTVRDPGVVLC